ncbi:MAG: hypothetical protein M8353_00140 [ANME-2 cluster archaeon]|nr:hypothetical protein [ANME-2 cluster archaeon]
MKSGLPEIPGTIPFFFLSGKRHMDISQKPDKDLFEHKDTYYQQSTRYPGTGTNNYERNRAFIRHLRSFSYDNTASEINNNNGSDGNKRSRFTPDILFVVHKWMIAVTDREGLSHRGLGISHDRIFNREVISQPKTGSIKDLLLNRIPFAGNMKDKDGKASSGLLSATSDLRPFVHFSYPSGNSTSSIQHRMGEYVPSTPQTSRSNLFFPDDHPNKGDTNEIDPHSTMIEEVEREHYEKGNKLNQLRKIGLIRRTADNVISHPFAIDHGVLKKRNPISGSSRIIKYGNQIPGIPNVFGEVPLTPSLLPFEYRRSSAQSRSGPVGEQEDDFITRTQRTHPVHMELVRTKDAVPQEIIRMKNDVAGEERSSSLKTSTNQMHIDMHYLTEQVYQKLEKKIRIERERRGM